MILLKIIYAIVTLYSTVGALMGAVLLTVVILTGPFDPVGLSKISPLAYIIVALCALTAGWIFTISEAQLARR